MFFLWMSKQLNIIDLQLVVLILRGRIHWKFLIAYPSYEMIVWQIPGQPMSNESSKLYFIFDVQSLPLNLIKSKVLSLDIQYIPRNMHTVTAMLCFVVVIHWLIFPYPSGLLHWHCGNLTIAPVPAKQPWWIWINTSCEFIMNDCITTTNKAQQDRVHISWDIL